MNLNLKSTFQTNKTAANVFRKGLVFLDSICLGDALQAELFLTGQSSGSEVKYYLSLIQYLAKVSFIFRNKVLRVRENCSYLRGSLAPN